MRIPKRYGQSRIENCPFCGKAGVMKNKQGVPVCLKHKDSYLDGLKCVCGEYLEVRSGKFGAYFTCMNCGNVNFKKAMEMNPELMEKAEVETNEEKVSDKKESDRVKAWDEKRRGPKKEIIVRSDELDFI